jgi:SAM-dependent methyltransferase
MKIKRSDLVLDVGSGHSPSWRSDVLCDRTMEPTMERVYGKAYPLRRDWRPLVIADGSRLPFRDKSFDYVICSHILEHVEDPAVFLREIGRVGKRGYIETPSEIKEALICRPYHRWLVGREGDKLVLRKILDENRSRFGDLFDYLYQNVPEYKAFASRVRELFSVRFEWEGSIKWELRPPDMRFSMDLTNEDVLRLLTKLEKKACLYSKLRPHLPLWLKWLRNPIRHVRQKKLDIREMLVCPACRGDLSWEGDGSICKSCGRSYSIKDGVPIMLAD